MLALSIAISTLEKAFTLFGITPDNELELGWASAFYKVPTTPLTRALFIVEYCVVVDRTGAVRDDSRRGEE